MRVLLLLKHFFRHYFTAFFRLVAFFTITYRLSIRCTDQAIHFERIIETSQQFHFFFPNYFRIQISHMCQNSHLNIIQSFDFSIDKIFHQSCCKAIVLGSFVNLLHSADSVLLRKRFSLNQ